MKTAFGDAFYKFTVVTYLLAAVSLLTVLTTAPVWAVALATDLAVTWPALVVAAPLAAPAVYAAFACFSEHAAGGVKFASVYLSAWRCGWRRTLPFGVAATALILVVAVDAVALAGSAAGALTIPLLVVTAAVTGATFVTATAAAQEFASTRRRDLVKAGLYCSIRHGGWSLATLAALALWGLFLTRDAVLALTLALGPVLYFTWANARHALRPLRQRLNGRLTATGPRSSGAVLPAPTRRGASS